jgi:hypothetical protein
MNTDQFGSANLPIKGNITPLYSLTLLIALLMAAVSVAGLQYRTVLYPSDELIQAFLANDVANLLIGFPMLLASMWLTLRRNIVGLLFWPGALFFVLYTYIVYIFAMPLNVAYLPYLALVMLSLYSLVGLLTKIDSGAVQQRLASSVPERLAGGVLALLGILFFLLVIGAISNAVISQIPITETELALHVADFLITPAWIICGVLLFRGKAFGYVTSLGLLFQASMLFIGLIIVLLLQPLISNALFSFVDVLVTFVLGLICFIPFLLFLRGILSDRRPLQE